MSSERPVIRVRDLSKCYQLYDRPVDRLLQTLTRGRRGAAREFWALRDVSFDVGPGECVGILGANGSGKSTLLQLIVGTLSPTSGDVQVRGRVAAMLELGSGFNPEFTGRENVFLNGAILGFSQREIRDRFDRITDFAGIGEFIDQPVKTYSSGMLVRLGFAVQVQVEPDVLIVDEALAVGDARFQLKCLARLEELRQRGTTVLFVSHSIEQVKQLCTKALLLDRGRKVLEGDTVSCGLEYYRLLFSGAAPTPAAGPNAGPETSSVPESAASTLPADAVRVDLSAARAYGKGGLTISGVTLHGAPRFPLVVGGESITVDVTYQFDVEHIRRIATEERVDPLLHFGMRVESQLGVTVTDIATGTAGAFPYGIALSELEALGGRLRLTYRFRVPYLQRGEYFVSPGVAVGRLGAAAPLVEFVHLFSLRCLPETPVHGLMRWDYTIEREGVS